MVHSLRLYWLYVYKSIYSFTPPRIMNNKTTKRIKLIKFAIGILIGVTIYLFIKLIF